MLADPDRQLLLNPRFLEVFDRILFRMSLLDTPLEESIERLFVFLFASVCVFQLDIPKRKSKIL
jgi:energy-converting hydrogenase Eha subunit F